jgi:transcriptional regulator with GAF, ATPase, and Fis domain
MARKVAGAEAEELASEAVAWVQRNLGPGYSWPGNYRELEQCVRNVLIRRDYSPSAPLAGAAIAPTSIAGQAATKRPPGACSPIAAP